MAEARPLVSCIMPTCNRRSFVPLAIQYFLRQDYPERELIVVDDGTDPVADLMPAGDARIRYIRLEGKRSLGAKRNLACEAAKGEIILHWDDDDWYAPHRIRYQVEALLNDGADLCGLPALYFYSLATGEAYRYSYPANRKPWVSGSTLCYTRALWQRNPFPEIDVGEDAHFVWSRAGKRLLRLDDLSIHVAMIHAGNVSPKNVLDTWWKPAPVIEVSRILGADWAVYAQPRDQVAAAAAVPVTAFGPAVAQAEHLTYPEFVAANLGRSLPRMRRWEIPFALAQARLGENMSVLDCTINPAGFQELLLGLYPNTLYRHWSPIQRGAFALPFGVPDGAFDRVICINTLEHLLAPQRAALMQAMARCLKPGGLLVITTDWYFDSLWVLPEALRIGVVRADRSEVFGGWNRVDLPEWRTLADAAGLRPVLMPERAPAEGEPGLYLNDPPFLHTSLGGVFAKGAFAAPARRVVLSLLTWNTRDISLESVQAYIQEARMLQRLGHEPYLCVCDNGSTDGTAEALKKVEQVLDLPHRFIYNAENLGNAIARNQIIDTMLECGADYLLFMDGDIEVIPGSSAAMLRYMEGRGARLGCLGADSAGQTQQRERATPVLFSVDGCRVDTVNYVAWTQYGLFRRALFADGVRFDCGGPFGRPGWGFEDNDLAFQIEQKGYVNQRFCGAVYLHRAPRSSTRNLRADGIDPNLLCEQRKQYVIEKWSGVPAIDQGPLNLVRRIQVQL